MAYYSDRENGPKARTIEESTLAAWRGIWALIATRLENGSFGHAFPSTCPDGNGVIGSYDQLLEAAANGHGVVWPIDRENVPDTLRVMDLLEFCYQHVAEPSKAWNHSFYTHYHLNFNVPEGREKFRSELEQILARNGIAFEMDENGEMHRLGPVELAGPLKDAAFHSGDDILDGLLGSARRKFTDPDLAVRKEALEKIWDAFERLKTVEPAKDKKAATEALLSKAIQDVDLRSRVNGEMVELTNIGNTFMIRHTEVGKTPITDSKAVDYLFQRMFSVVRLLLRGTNRGS